MHVEAPKKLFTVDDYYRMAEVGIIGPEDRVELIDGEIVEMSPIGPKHLGCVNRITALFVQAFQGRAVLSPQNPLRLSKYTEPEPDIVLFKFRPDFYSSKIPTPDDALLVIEISDTSLEIDREIKLPRYAAAGVPEVWIVNLREDRLMIHRDPSSNGYRFLQTLDRNDSISPLAFPESTFRVDQILG